MSRERKVSESEEIKKRCDYILSALRLYNTQIQNEIEKQMRLEVIDQSYVRELERALKKNKMLLMNAVHASRDIMDCVTMGRRIDAFESIRNVDSS